MTARNCSRFRQSLFSCRESGKRVSVFTRDCRGGAGVFRGFTSVLRLSGGLRGGFRAWESPMVAFERPLEFFLAC
jgi:hypothetical protein